MTFGVTGGFEAGKRFYDALTLVKRLVNLGDAKTLACHPASTTHRQMSAEEQRTGGVTPEMIRLSVGIEHVDDIIADLDQALRRRWSRFTGSGVMMTAPNVDHEDTKTRRTHEERLGTTRSSS